MKKILSIAITCLTCLALTVSAFAATVPSIEGKLAPEIVKEGTKIAVIVDGEEVLYDVEENDLIVTPFTNREKANENLSPELKERITNNLNSAFDEVKKNEDLGKLNSGLDSKAKDINKDYNSSVFVAQNLFDVTISDLTQPEYLRTIKQEGTYLKIKFNVNLKADDPTPVIMFRDIDTGKWEIVEKVVRNADNTVTAYFGNLGAVLFLNADGSRMSAKPSTTGDAGVAVLATVLSSAVIMLAVVLKRRSAEEN